MADANTTQSNAVPVTGAGTSSNASPVAVTETKTDAAKQRQLMRMLKTPVAAWSFGLFFGRH